MQGITVYISLKQHEESKFYTLAIIFLAPVYYMKQQQKSGTSDFIFSELDTEMWNAEYKTMYQIHVLKKYSNHFKFE